ncbi:MAG: hypothetical protein ABW208_25625 [Pyrinomonadaceae bacterium]
MKYVLVFVTALVMQGTVRACSDAPAQKTPPPLGERLAQSEYVVEKGKLARRKGAAESQDATRLGREEELRTMEKSLEAAKAKLSIPEGSGVVVVEGKEFYEVVIGSPRPGDAEGEGYAAKVFVDKQTLAVAQVKSNEMNNSDEEIARKVAQFRAMSAKLAQSEYVVEKGKLARRKGAAESQDATRLGREEELRTMEKALDAVRDKLNLPEGAGVIVVEGEEYYEVIIGNPPGASGRGPDYTAKVFVDKQTLAVARILSGS